MRDGGTITAIGLDEHGADLEIPAEGAPARHVLSEPGDSGAMWVDAATRRGVAIHLRGGATPKVAFAASLDTALAVLELTL